MATSKIHSRLSMVLVLLCVHCNKSKSLFCSSTSCHVSFAPSKASAAESGRRHVGYVCSLLISGFSGLKPKFSANDGCSGSHSRSRGKHVVQLVIARSYLLRSVKIPLYSLCSCSTVWLVVTIQGAPIKKQPLRKNSLPQLL